MEVISLKLDDVMLDNIDKSLKKHNFSTRTEFIRHALRKELESMTQEELIQKFLSFKGKAKVKHTDEEWEQVKERAYRKLAKERGWK